jgi:FMN phosphatase YigB (HAD superfamily)
MFHAVTISEESGSEAFNIDTLFRTLEKRAVKADNSMFVESDLSREIAIANAAKMMTVRIRTGTNRTSSVKAANEKPAFEIIKLVDLFGILQQSV